MATTSIWSVKGWLGKLVVYVENPDKTDNPKFFEKAEMNTDDKQGLFDVIDYATQDVKTSESIDDENIEVVKNYITGVNCTTASARDEMMIVKKRYAKEDGVVAYHGYQSFAEGEVTASTSHEIGVKLANEVWGEKYQVLVATHLDKENHIHNHFIVNTVSFVDGTRYHRTNKDYFKMRTVSDKLCKEYQLSVIEETKKKGKHYGVWRAENEGRQTWLSLIRSDIDKAISESLTDKQFFHKLREQGYFIKMGKDITVRPKGKERGVKLARNFGDEYTYEKICERILNNLSVRKARKPSTSKRVVRYLGAWMQRPRRSSLRAVYFAYRYRLRKASQRSRLTNAQVEFVYRDDLMRMRQISNEAQYLEKHSIDTIGEVKARREVVAEEIKELCIKRKKLKGRLPIKDLPIEKQNEVKALNEVIKSKRKEVECLNSIETRAVKLAQSKAESIKETQKELVRGGERV